MTTLLAAVLLAQRPKPLAGLPFVHEPGRIWLKAHLNDKAVEAVLDTGAACCVADPDAANAAGAKSERIESANGIGTRAIDTWATRNLRLSLDGFDERQDVAYASDLSRMGQGGGRRPDVLVGGDLLKRFAVEIDYAASRVRLYDPATYAPPEGLKALKVRFETDRPVVDLYLRLPGADEETVSALLDTGSGGLTLTGALVKREGLLARYPDARPTRGLGGLAGAEPGRALSGISGFLGRLPFGGAALLDTGKSGLTGPDAPYDALVGDGPLAGGLLVLDYGRYTLYVGRLKG